MKKKKKKEKKNRKKEEVRRRKKKKEKKMKKEKKKKNVCLHFLLFFNCVYITNSKTGVCFHDTFQSRKGCNRRNILKSTASAVCC